MAHANATLVMGWRLDQLCEVKQVQGPPKFDVNTGKPVVNSVDALFVLGQQVEDPGEFYPGEWSGELAMQTFSCGDGSERGMGRGLRAYDLSAFTAGLKVAKTPDDRDQGSLVKVVADFVAYENQAWEAIAELCKKIGLDSVPKDLPSPALYMVCYYSY